MFKLKNPGTINLSKTQSNLIVGGPSDTITIKNNQDLTGVKISSNSPHVRTNFNATNGIITLTADHDYFAYSAVITVTGTDKNTKQQISNEINVRIERTWEQWAIAVGISVGTILAMLAAGYTIEQIYHYFFPPTPKINSIDLSENSTSLSTGSIDTSISITNFASLPATPKITSNNDNATATITNNGTISIFGNTAGQTIFTISLSNYKSVTLTVNVSAKPFTTIELSTNLVNMEALTFNAYVYVKNFKQLQNVGISVQQPYSEYSNFIYTPVYNISTGEIHIESTWFWGPASSKQPTFTINVFANNAKEAHIAVECTDS